MSTLSTPQLLNRLRMRQLSLLLSVGRLGTLRAAAAELGMTQPAATKMLQELEDALQQALFERAGRNLRFNEAGRRVLEYCQGIQGNLSALTRELAQIELGSVGKLVVGTIMAASPALLSRALIELKRLYPLLAIEITVDTSDRLTDALRRGEMDLVVGRIPDFDNQHLGFEAIAEEALSIVSAPQHPLAHRDSVSLAELTQYPWILQPQGSPMRDVLEQEFRSRQIQPPRAPIETSSILTTTNLLVQSDMVAVIPTEVALKYQSHGLLACLNCDIHHRLNPYGIITAKGRPPSQVSAALMQLLRDASRHHGR